MDLGDAAAMARGLMEEHGLHDWTLVWDGARTRAGVCWYRRRQIGLSRVLTALHDEPRVRDTVLHEVAHALAGPAAGHGPVWKAKARELGCRPERCLDPDAPKAPAPWVGRCAAGHETRAYRAPQRVKSCLRCRSGFSVEALYEWRLHGRVVPMPARYVAELRLLRATALDPAVRHLVVPTQRPRPRPLPPGTPVRIVTRGRFAGVVGVVERAARTRYRVRTAHGLLNAPFEGVEAVR